LLQQESFDKILINNLSFHDGCVTEVLQKSAGLVFPTSF
jgi:hypothetical protein